MQSIFERKVKAISSAVYVLLFIHSFLQIPKGVPMSYTLLLKRVLAVENLKPAVINIYDYYQTSTLLSFYALLWLILLLNMIYLFLFHFQVTRLRPPTCPPVHDVKEVLSVGRDK